MTKKSRRVRFVRPVKAGNQLQLLDCSRASCLVELALGNLGRLVFTACLNQLFAGLNNHKLAQNNLCFKLGCSQVVTGGSLISPEGYNERKAGL